MSRFAALCMIYPITMSAHLFGAQTEDISTLYRDIGSDLITIRKENPALQETVYAVLDRVGRLYRAANTAVQEKTRSEQIAKEDHSALDLLRGENQQLQTELQKLKGELSFKNLEVAKAKQQVTIMVREHEDLRTRARDGEEKMQELKKAIETSLDKREAHREQQGQVAQDEHQTIAQGTAEQASLVGDRARAAMQEFDDHA